MKALKSAIWRLQVSRRVRIIARSILVALWPDFGQIEALIADLRAVPITRGSSQRHIVWIRESARRARMARADLPCSGDLAGGRHDWSAESDTNGSNVFVCRRCDALRLWSPEIRSIYSVLDQICPGDPLDRRHDWRSTPSTGVLVC